MKQQSRLDYDHPCLACGEPWEIIEQTIDVAEPGVPELWTPVRSSCSARCVETGRSSIETFNAALEARRQKGW
jgi:hypothetical protein